MSVYYDEPFGAPVNITIIPPRIGPEPMSLELYDIAPGSVWEPLGPVFIKADGKPAKLNDVIRYIGASKSMIGRFVKSGMNAYQLACALICLNGAVRSSLRKPKKAGKD